MIKIYSSFSKDKIYKNGKLIKSLRRGPAFFIEKVLKKEKISHEMFTKKDFEINIEIADNNEMGKIVFCDNNKLINNISHDDNILISTIADEWTLDTNIPEGVKLFLDIQGYVRRYKKKSNFFQKNFWTRLVCIKGTEKEISSLPEEIVKKQKEKLLIITKGDEGCIIYSKGKRYKFKGSKIEVGDAIGAGDTFFANFFIEYLESGDFIKSAELSITKTENFLLSK